MAGFDVFTDYLGLCEILFDDGDTSDKNTTLSAVSPRLVPHLSVSSSMDSLTSDNSGSVDISNTSLSGSPQCNQPLESVPELSASLSSTPQSPFTTPPMSMTPPMVPVTAISPSDVVDEVFASGGSLDVIPVGRAISGRRLTTTPTSEITAQRSNVSEVPDIGEIYTPRQQHRDSPNFHLTQIVQGMVKHMCRNEISAVGDKFTLNKVCAFCQRNGETKEFYTTHVLKDSKGKVICPVLRSYVCPSCKATGDQAHTIRHCPLSRGDGSMADTFKTRRTSCGFRKLNTP